MQKIFIVTHNGGWIEGVYDSHEKAEQHLERIAKAFGGDAFVAGNNAWLNKWYGSKVLIAHYLSYNVA